MNKNPAGSLSAPVRDRAAVATLKAKFQVQNVALVVAFFVALLLVPLIPGFKGWMASQAALVVVYILAAQGLSILTGYTGLVSVGHGGFLAIGAYTAALLVKHANADIVLSLIAGAAMAGVIGMLMALVFLRLAGPFLAIGTLGFAFFVGTVVNNVKFFEGREGISVPANHALGLPVGDIGFYYISIILLALVTLFIYSLVRSSVGRALKGLRDAEKAAQSCGVNRLLYRTLAFTISAAITGLAGALSALTTRYVSAEVFGDIWYSVDFLVAAVVGGSAMLMGPIVGGIFVAMLPFFLEKLADFAFILKGVALIAVLMFAPAGVCDVIARPFRAWRRRRLERAAAGEEPVRREPPVVALEGKS
ncbi:MAG TPA: branched-chain amino acid ABC transporter permease [Usitatibacter sp.]|nr:branched-chain amino acid ABC transporter permease [Usitatibacter sp.]